MNNKHRVTISLPKPYKEQTIFVEWRDRFPKAQMLVIPCGTKVGKSFGSAIFLAKEALSQPNLYCAWIAPTYMKARIGYRYMKFMLPKVAGIECIDGKLEIRLPNGTYIKFMHGSDAETTVEGEAIDRFVIDESGKIDKQVFYSLLTTITQTMGYGIVTGTPRGFNFYADIYQKAVDGDPFYCHGRLPTHVSPYVTKASILNARRILPKHLYLQYYEAKFGQESEVFPGFFDSIDHTLEIKKQNFWIHPNKAERDKDTYTGWDIAKTVDYSVFTTVNTDGVLVGFARFKQVPYDQQIERLLMYQESAFGDSDQSLRYDATGVGGVISDLLTAKDVDVVRDAVMFSNRSKQEMINKLSVAIDTSWLKVPNLEIICKEMASYEVSITKSGLFSYNAPAGYHDDCVSSLMLSVSGAYHSAQAEETDKLIASLTMGDNIEYDEIIDNGKSLDDWFGDDDEDDFDYNELTE